MHIHKHTYAPKATRRVTHGLLPEIAIHIHEYVTTLRISDGQGLC